MKCQIQFSGKKISSAENFTHILNQMRLVFTLCFKLKQISRRHFKYVFYFSSEDKVGYVCILPLRLMSVVDVCFAHDTIPNRLRLTLSYAIMLCQILFFADSNTLSQNTSVMEYSD